MRIPIAEAKNQLSELVARAEAEEEIVLTRQGDAAVRLVPVHSAQVPQGRMALLAKVRKSGGEKALAGPTAARSQDFLC